MLFLYLFYFCLSFFSVKGFLKVSIQVIGPNDDPITIPEVTSQETVDIEA